MGCPLLLRRTEGVKAYICTRLLDGHKVKEVFESNASLKRCESQYKSNASVSESVLVCECVTILVSFVFLN